MWEGALRERGLTLFEGCRLDSAARPTACQHLPAIVIATATVIANVTATVTATATATAGGGWSGHCVARAARGGRALLRRRTGHCAAGEGGGRGANCPGGAPSSSFPSPSCSGLLPSVSPRLLPPFVTPSGMDGCPRFPPHPSLRACPSPSISLTLTLPLPLPTPTPGAARALCGVPRPQARQRAAGRRRLPPPGRLRNGQAAWRAWRPGHVSVRHTGLQ